MQCEARNSAAKSQNAEVMRKAEGTAKYVCDADRVKCKWQYSDVYLAEEENCAALSAASNHIVLAEAARDAVKRLRVEALAMDKTWSKWVVKLADAEASAKVARSARHSVAAPLIAAQDYRMSAESIVAADASLAGIRD
jgi:hypothetical protein